MQEVKTNHKKDITRWSAEDSFSDPSKVGAALLQCLIDNDTETYIEILESYLRMNKLQVAKKAKMPRSTVQLAFSKSGNPTLKTLAKIVHEASLKR
jgi:DNA-binding phage protein